MSITLDVGCCVEAVERALEVGQPEILNSDQARSLQPRFYPSRLEAAGLQILWMDGTGPGTTSLWSGVAKRQV